MSVARGRHLIRAAAALGATLLATSLVGCTPQHHAKAGPGTAVGSALASPALSSTPSTPPSTTLTSPAAAVDGRADPGAFASDLHWTDISAQMNKAIGDTGKRKFLFARSTMDVPLDWADARNGKHVTITALRIRAADQKSRIGSLVINPGGPGVSAVDFSWQIAVAELPNAILDRFDIIGFDPRGIGLSSPVNCIAPKEKDDSLGLPPDPLTQAAWDSTLAENAKVAQECYAKYGNDLTYYSTTATVRDMEALRAKLGEPKLTYLGFSYGTLIGAEYAAAYPGKVRALVLDGAVDPTISPLDQDKTQADGFQLAFSHFAAACTKTRSACQLGADPQAYVLNLMKRAAAHPIPSGDASDGRKATDGHVLLAVIQALYDPNAWPVLTDALVNATKGDASGILALDDEYTERSPDGVYTNVEDADATISCADNTQRPTTAQARALQPVWRQENPLFGGSAAAGLEFCSLWKAPPDETIKVADNHSPPVLVVGTTGDPATPISGAKHLSALLGSGRLLVWEGDGHTAYLRSSCITSKVNSYLLDLKLPASGTTCPAS
ncbi:MAG: hypothetical protein QOJ62_1353 [Actinomycetota bacterium]|nr:hypothetical protein [Actinomycetota bacterium]